MLTSKHAELELVTMWSIRVAELRVTLVGFVTICNNPCEKSTSMQSETLLDRPYFKQSILRSPKTKTLFKELLNCSAKAEYSSRILRELLTGGKSKMQSSGSIHRTNCVFFRVDRNIDKNGFEDSIDKNSQIMVYREI